MGKCDPTLSSLKFDDSVDEPLFCKTWGEVVERNGLCRCQTSSQVLYRHSGDWGCEFAEINHLCYCDGKCTADPSDKNKVQCETGDVKEIFEEAKWRRQATK